jgi:hypothetical protein
LRFQYWHKNKKIFDSGTLTDNAPISQLSIEATTQKSIEIVGDHDQGAGIHYFNTGGSKRFGKCR